ncbi:MAG: hypothetical protein K1060chlam5_01269 [Candidatus Anoxychlamydiales bacterium]|nr:hypothetical protein [Candidatus Anoxychlamydiales bacterium]
MKQFIIYSITSLFLLTSCVKSTTQYGAIAEKNRIKMLNITKEMSSCDVSLTMGRPYKTETKEIDNKKYEVWFYVTENPILGQTMLIKRNFTPLIFEDCKLIGWGKTFYKHVFDIDNAKNKAKEEERQKYTNDKEEWPRNKHLEVKPLNEKKEDEVTDKVLDEKKEEIENESPCHTKDSSKDYNFWE